MHSSYTHRDVGQEECCMLTMALTILYLSNSNNEAKCEAYEANLCSINGNSKALCAMRFQAHYQVSEWRVFALKNIVLVAYGTMI